MDAAKNQGYFTIGNSDEASALSLFDDIIIKSEAFHIYREVEGEYIQPRIETIQQDARIDRILTPKNRILDAGWKRGGAIGVEGKKSGDKLGPLITQAMDYSRCAFKLKTSKGDLLSIVSLRWVFIYPAETLHHDLGSITANHRIGTCWVSHNGSLNFGCCGTTAIIIQANGAITQAKDPPMGNKRGSR